LALGCGVGQDEGFGIGELGDPVADGEPNIAEDCGSAIGVADGSGAMVTVVRSLERLGIGLAAGSFGGGAETGLCWAWAAKALSAAARAMIGSRISTLLPVQPI
jgi:hypothetical protein